MATRIKRRKTVRKTEVVTIRVTQDQKRLLGEAAERVGLGVSPWLLTLGMREADKNNN